MEIAQISLLGALLALDGTSVGQFMVSRPLVAGTLAGWALGVPGLGITIGAILELYLIVSFPTGGARFPEGSTATVVAVAAASSTNAAGGVALAIAIGLVWGQLGGSSITEPHDASHGPARVVGAHLVAIALDFGRGALVTATGVVAGRYIVSAMVAAWPLADGASTGLLLAGGAVSAGILLRDLGGFRRRRMAFVAGLALGIIGTRFL
jgi:mannose/fructose/N-acetylgalactosamine-specific phosphotransferase system component IIC